MLLLGLNSEICITVGCKDNSECPTDRACYNRQCVNPCIIEDPCDVTAECYARNHQAECRCREGYEGDPRARCNLLGCRSNQDCPIDKACVNRQCVNPCDQADPCAPNAQCVVENHAAGCKCPPGLGGNPFDNCSPEEPVVEERENECVFDSDCPSKSACIKQRCQDPCKVIAPCDVTARCNVLDTEPLRTMICICPDGWVPLPDGRCQPGKSTFYLVLVW